MLKRRLEYLIATYGPLLARHVHRDFLWRVECNGCRDLFLTFDDGPTRDLTFRLLDTLSRHSARATFFLLAKNIEKYPDAVGRIEQGGHCIGLHGFEHLDAWRTDAATVLADLDHGLRVLDAHTSKPVRFFRPPYGRFRNATRAWARANGLTIVMWDVMPGDFIAGTTATRIVSRVERRVSSGSVIVLHDSRNPNVVEHTAPAVDKLIPALQRSGWRFESL